ncbi:MAG: metal ABC transporter substrate-binding protein [Actinomycetota bacterium]
MRRMFVRVALLPLLLGVLPACSSTAGARPDGRPEVAASFYSLAWAVRAAAGDAVRVVDLTPPGGEPHDVELRPRDLIRLRTADLVVYMGGGFQPAVEGAVQKGAPALNVLDVLNPVQLLPKDPHVWLDPALMSQVVSSVASAISRQIPVGARAEVVARAQRSARALEDLDQSYRDTLSKCARRDLVTAHDAFGYLARRYGLRQIPIAGTSPESEPAPRHFEDVVRIARARGVTTVFSESIVSPRVAAAVARAVGARTAMLNPIESLTREGRAAGDDYVSIMRVNLRVLAEGLGCPRPL